MKLRLSPGIKLCWFGFGCFFLNDTVLFAPLNYPNSKENPKKMRIFADNKTLNNYSK